MVGIPVQTSPDIVCTCISMLTTNFSNGGIYAECLSKNLTFVSAELTPPPISRLRAINEEDVLIDPAPTKSYLLNMSAANSEDIMDARAQKVVSELLKKVVALKCRSTRAHPSALLSSNGRMTSEMISAPAMPCYLDKSKISLCPK